MAKRRLAFQAPGWAYVVRIANGPTKIGVTYGRDPYIRIKEISARLPYPIIVLGLRYLDKVDELEQTLHNKFKNYFLKNEWFDLPDDVLAQLITKYGLMSESEAAELVNIKARGGWPKGFNRRREWRSYE